MKVLSSLITAAVVAQAAALTKEEQLRLLRKAKPLSARKLQENNAGAYVTTADSIKFNACVSLTALPEQGDQEFIASSDYMKGLFEAGDIVSQTSAVLFSICATADCSTDTSEENLYVTDLGSFMQLTGYRPQKTFDYCEACKQSQDYCAALAEGDGQEEEAAAAEGEEADAAEGEEADAAEGEDAARRKLAAAQYVSCDQCNSLKCFQEEEQQNNNNGQQQLTLEGMVQWVQQQGECVQTGMYWENMGLYSSWMCNQEGDGVELALFLDDNCQLYTASTSYSSLYPDDLYVSNSQSVVTYPFLNDIDCAADIEWRSPEEEANGEQQAAQDDANQEANEYCRQLLQDGNVLALNNCYANGNNQNNNNNQNQNQGDYYEYFSQWEYNLNGREEINTPAAVCTALKNMQGEYVSFKTTKKTYNVYKNDEGHSGSNYHYKKGSAKSGLSGGAIAGIVIAVLVALGVGFVVTRVLKKKRDSKREPLVSADGVGA